MPWTQRGNSSSRPAIVAIVCAFAGEQPAFQATNAGTDRAPVTPHKPSRSMSATISTMRPSIALRWPDNSAHSSNNTSRRSLGLTTTAPTDPVEDMTSSSQPGTTKPGRPNRVPYSVDVRRWVGEGEIGGLLAGTHQTAVIVGHEVGTHAVGNQAGDCHTTLPGAVRLDRPIALAQNGSPVLTAGPGGRRCGEQLRGQQQGSESSDDAPLHGCLPSQLPMTLPVMRLRTHGLAVFNPDPERARGQHVSHSLSRSALGRS